MKTHSKALYAGMLLAALLPFSAALSASDTPAPEAPLHEIGAPSDASPTPTPAPTPTRSQRHYHDDDGNRVRINGSATVGPNESIDENAVAVNGDLTVDGTVEGNGVAVFGSTLINGTVDGNGVAVLGSTTINGTVHGNAVAVLGSLRLGPNARVDGNAVSIGGNVIKDPSATVGGQIVPVYFGVDSGDPEAAALWKHGLRMGRPLAFGPHLHVFWIAQLCAVALYLLLALVFPNGVRKCADTLEHRPGITVLTGFLAMLGMPVLIVLLCITVIGIPVAFVVLPLGAIACLMFGKTALYSLIGRAIVGRSAQSVAAVMVGVLLSMVLYFVPVLGLMVWFLIAFLGFACALTTLLTSRTSAPAAAPVQPAAPSGAFAAAVPEAPVLQPALPLAQAAPAPILTPAAPLPPPLSPSSEAALPRAGFWIRMGALLLDVILVGIVTHMGDWFLPALALYGALLWHLKGSTVGGIIFGLKVVRIDGKPSEWAIMAVRALACFFSLIIVGLGFIWIAFDPQKQAWHDKIAGTVVVRVPKGVSLV